MIHVVPKNDAISHELIENCVCGPRVVKTQGFNGEVTHFVEHHRLFHWLPSHPADSQDGQA